MKKTKRISLKLAVLIAICVGIAIMVIVLINIKNIKIPKNESNISSSDISTNENMIIQNIRNTFNIARKEFIINSATLEDYKPNSCSISSDGTGTGTAFEIKNTIISNLGENVIDESKNALIELNLDIFKKETGEKVELTNGYHVYLSNGEYDNEKFITIVYKDDVFCHGMAYYDTQNNLVIDNSNNLYPVLVAQIRLSENDLGYYLEPVKSVK